MEELAEARRACIILSVFCSGKMERSRGREFRLSTRLNNTAHSDSLVLLGSSSVYVTYACGAWRRGAYIFDAHPHSLPLTRCEGDRHTIRTQEYPHTTHHTHTHTHQSRFILIQSQQTTENFDRTCVTLTFTDSYYTSIEELRLARRSTADTRRQGDDSE